MGNRVFHWELRDDRVYLRTVSYEAMADPSVPEYQAMDDANVTPIVAGFDVEAYGPDRSGHRRFRPLHPPAQELGPGHSDSRERRCGPFLDR